MTTEAAFAADHPVARLEAAFRHIAGHRMAGVALLNPALAVEAVGFRSWNGDWLGILVTPWFMNLICLPGPECAWSPRNSGTPQDVELPSGTYEFLHAREDLVGHYLSCSLFSPMFGFTDMDQARAVADATLAELFTAAGTPPQPSPSQTAPAPQQAAGPGLQAKLEQPVSRRGFLGALFRPPENRP